MERSEQWPLAIASEAIRGELSKTRFRFSKTDLCCKTIENR
jgi:hypothetical protein